MQKPSFIYPFCLVCLTLLFLSCGKPHDRYATSHDSLTDAECAMLEPGDLILRRSKGVAGLMIAKRLREAVPVTHVGIIARFEGRWIIFQSVGGGVSNVVRYGVHYVTPGQFLEFTKDSTLVVARLKQPAEIRKAVVERAWYYHDRKLPFDYNYDLDNHDAIFCTELVYLAVSEEVGNDFFRRITTDAGYEYIPFNAFLNPEHFDIILSHHPKHHRGEAAE